MKRTLGIVALCLASSVVVVACGGDDNGSKDSASSTATDTQSGASMSDTAADKEKSSSGTSMSDTAAGDKQSSAGSSGKGVSVKVMSSRYGRMLFDGKGRALYLFTRERTTRSRCYGECARAWPPFLTKGKPRTRSGVSASLLGTTRRRGGGTQVTYRGHPLYYYVSDREPGEVTCQDVAEFGGTWLVVSPSGRAIS